MEQITSLTLSSTDDPAKGNRQMDFQDEQTCLEETNTMCTTENQISDLIIASEVNKMLLAR